jgi:AbrB family looped-hinge helix DNA binding protein
MCADDAGTRLVSQSCHGRVTIPIEFRRTLGIRGGETLEMWLEGGELRIRRLGESPRALTGTERATDAGGRRAHDE